MKNNTSIRLIQVFLLLLLINIISVSAVSPVSLKLWHIWCNDPTFQTVLENFNQSNPNIQLEINGMNYGYDTRIKTAIAANEAPDIFFTWGGGFSAPFVKAGKVLPLDNYLSNSSKNKLSHGSLTNYTYDGKVYGLPTRLAIGILYCNKMLFNKYGVKIPETYQELINAVKVFNDNGILPISVGERDLWPGMFWYDALALRTAGVRLCHEALTKKASFNRPEFTEAAAKLVELVQLGAFGDHALERTWDESLELFIQGKAAMIFGGTWVASVFEDNSVSVKGKIAAQKFPVIEGGKGTANEYLGGPSDGFMVSANTKYKKEAVQVVEYICEAMSKQSYLNGNGLPLWGISETEAKPNQLILEQSQMVRNASAFLIWWDVFLQGNDAGVHKSLVQKLFSGAITPQKFSIEMQKLNENK